MTRLEVLERRLQSWRVELARGGSLKDAAPRIIGQLEAEIAAEKAHAKYCTIGACQRHGKCMYLNHPRCPMVQAREGGDYEEEPEQCVKAAR